MVKKSKELISALNVTEIMLHARIDDYDEIITSEDHIDGSYSKVIIDGKNYFGFPQSDEKDEGLVYDWEETLSTYLNSIIPQP